MDIICILTLLAACLIASSHCASHDVEWIYGMTENELCVAPGQAQFHVYLHLLGLTAV